MRMAKRGPITHYRLSRRRIRPTVYDLLGVYFDVKMPGAFNEDPRWHGFDRIGSLLSLSPSQWRYFSAAETVLDERFPLAAEAQKTRRDADDGKWKAAGHSGRYAGCSGRATVSTCSMSVHRDFIAFAFNSVPCPRSRDEYHI